MLRDPNRNANMLALKRLPARRLPDIYQRSYDQWLAPDGSATARLYRCSENFLIRFLGQADFEIDAGMRQVCCTPAPGVTYETIETLYFNCVLPLIGNYMGELNLHGSAVCVDGQGLAFLGVSRRGKTTLAAAFASHGYPFLSEDVLAIEIVERNYHMKPARPVLRLFADSASRIAKGSSVPDQIGLGQKTAIPADARFPFQREPVPLTGLFLLGAGQTSKICVQTIEPARALAEILQHSFILDVEDKPRLGAHFHRLGALAEAVICYELDYPRVFEQLPNVINAIVARVHSDGARL